MVGTKVGICGSSAADDEPIVAMASLLGRILAERGHIVLTGAGDGLPHTVATSAIAHGGRVEGFSPAQDIDEHSARFKFPTDGATVFHFRPEGFEFASTNMACLKMRNVLTISSSDAVVFIKGKTGTLNEFTIAYDMGKIIGGLIGAGGVADQIPELVKLCNKPMGSVVIMSADPADLLSRLETEHARITRPS